MRGVENLGFYGFMVLGVTGSGLTGGKIEGFQGFFCCKVFWVLGFGVREVLEVWSIRIFRVFGFLGIGDLGFRV